VENTARPILVESSYATSY